MQRTQKSAQANTRAPDATRRLTGEQFSSRDLADETLIGLEKIEPRKIAAIDPADLLKNSVLHLAFILFHAIEMQLHRSTLLVMMLNRSDLFADCRGNAKLFFELSPQGRRLFFARFD